VAEFFDVGSSRSVPWALRPEATRLLESCRLFGRRAEARWVHGRPGYRCRHGRTSASPPIPGRAKPFYLSEEVIIGAVLRRIGHAAGDELGSAGVAVYLRIFTLAVGVLDAPVIGVARRSA
jgi:site-specific DNA recombinase